jgi:peroxiredoxin
MVIINAIVLSTFMFLTGLGDGLKVGDQAMDFKLKNIDGQMVSLAGNSQAKGYILIFTCNTCPYSVAYEDRIIELNQKYASQGYPVVAVQPNDTQRSPGDSFDKMKQRAKKKGFDFPYLIDETQEVTRTYGATNTPHVYVLDRTSKDSFIIKYIGAIDNNSRDASAADKHYVEDAVDNLIKGNPVETDKTKAIGCTIKWAS